MIPKIQFVRSSASHSRLPNTATCETSLDTQDQPPPGSLNTCLAYAVCGAAPCASSLPRRNSLGSGFPLRPLNPFDTGHGIRFGGSRRPRVNATTIGRQARFTKYRARRLMPEAERPEATNEISRPGFSPCRASQSESGWGDKGGFAVVEVSQVGGAGYETRTVTPFLAAGLALWTAGLIKAICKQPSA